MRIYSMSSTAKKGDERSLPPFFFHANGTLYSRVLFASNVEEARQPTRKERVKGRKKAGVVETYSGGREKKKNIITKKILNENNCEMKIRVRQ